jgi:hypothetical protein
MPVIRHRKDLVLGASLAAPILQRQTGPPGRPIAAIQPRRSLRRQTTARIILRFCATPRASRATHRLVLSAWIHRTFQLGASPGKTIESYPIRRMDKAQRAHPIGIESADPPRMASIGRGDTRETCRLRTDPRGT